MYIFLLLLWIIYNGKITVEITIFGLIIATAVYAFMIKFMDFRIKTELRIIRNIPFGIAYVFVLICEIIKANFSVMKLVTTPNIDVEPAIVHFKVNLSSDLARVVLANSITLTPGTITISYTENNYVVHCLDKELAEGIDDSIFVKLLMRMEKGVERKVEENA